MRAVKPPQPWLRSGPVRQRWSLPEQGRFTHLARSALRCTPLECAALLSAARTSSPKDHALVCLLGMLGLRVSEACAADITDIRYESGYEVLHIVGKGAKPADIPLPIPVLRAVRAVIGERTGSSRHDRPSLARHRRE